jgi:hypothetical protein
MNIGHKRPIQLTMIRNFFIPIVTLFFISVACDKTDEEIEIVPKGDYLELIEEITMNPNGVVFKILNDIDSAVYQTNNTTNLSPTNLNRYFCAQGTETGFIIKIDSICLRKFHYNGPDNLSDVGYTWFTKKGQYVCWRDLYNLEEVGSSDHKWLDLGFPNRYRDIYPEKFCIYSQLSFTTIEEITKEEFLKVFPKPINDTVYTRLSLFKTEKAW